MSEGRLRSILRRGPSEGASEVQGGELPIPPLELRRLVGPTDEADFDNPSGELVYPYLDASLYERFFDFGCGCGRVARQLIQQDPQPERYVGVDLHKGMVRWCERNLAPHAPQFSFHHHDVGNVTFNPGPHKPPTRRLPGDDATFTLVHAWSVFTHLTQPQCEFYLREVARILAPGGVFHGTWFLTDKRYFPMMRARQNALYINEIDPTNAVIFDREWMQREVADAGLAIVAAKPPESRGYHWVIQMKLRGEGVEPIELPPDDGPLAPEPVESDED